VNREQRLFGGWRRLHNEDLHILYASPNVIGMMKEDQLGDHVACMTEMRNSYKILVGTPERKRTRKI